MGLRGGNDRMISIAWFCVGLVATILCYHFRLALPERYVVDAFVAKITLLGLVGATATFQYGWWHSFAQRQLELLYEPAWLALDRWFAENSERKKSEELRWRQLQQWLEWRSTAARSILNGALRHNSIVLTSLAVSAYLLLLSVIAELSAVLLDPKNSLSHALALGAFVSALAAFVDIWRRYFRSLGAEFADWQTRFSHAEKNQGEKGRGVANTP